LALTDGGCHSDCAWVEESFPAIEVSAEGILQLYNMDRTSRVTRINVSDV
jgi:hypothetical protein